MPVMLFATRKKVFGVVVFGGSELFLSSDEVSNSIKFLLRG
jgi:hypothetical protein